MQMCSAMVYCKIILRGNKSCRGNESVGGEREEGKLYYLVVAAMGPNYGYAFVSVLKTFPPFLKNKNTFVHFASHLCHTSCHTYITNQFVSNKCSTAPVLITAVYLSLWHLISFQRLLSAKPQVTISQCIFLFKRK